ncbi:MAG: 30S ribosomal protein S2 [Candidatus Nitrosocaldaceae archaeon]
MSVDVEGTEKILLSTGIRVGTPVKTKSMEKFIVKANPEGLYILDIVKTLERIEVAASFISRIDTKRFIVCSAREYGKVPVEKFCELINATPLIGRFMPGTFTNSLLPNYMEPLLIMVTDPQFDQQAIVEASKAGVPVIAISNSDNIISKIDLVIPANNRGRKSLATVYWLLTKAVLLKTGRLRAENVSINSFIYDGKEYRIDDFETKLEEGEE